MKVSDVMTPKVVTISKERGLHEVIKIMSESKISSIVITKNDKVVGLVTERDLIKKILLVQKDSKKAKLSDVLTKPVISVRPDTPFHEASLLMKERHIRHLPVIEDGVLLGMVTQTDIVKETHNIQKKNVIFMNYQNIQTVIIILFFLFAIVYLLFKKFSA